MAAPEKKVQVVGFPPEVQGPPKEVETDSENEQDHREEPEVTGDEDEVVNVPDELDEEIQQMLGYQHENELYLDMSHMRISSLKQLNLARFGDTLQRIDLRQNQIKHMSGKELSHVPNLKELDLYDNSIEHISGLENLLELEYVTTLTRRSLDLSFNNIRHISRISHLPKLETVYFVQNKIARVRPLDFQPPLTHCLINLELGGNRLRSLENLSSLVNLEQLWIGKNKLTSLKLRIISAQSNRLTKLEGLETLTELEELYFSHNAVTELSGLENNHKLSVLDLAANQVESFDGVQHLNLMSQFYANDNKVKDLSVLDKYLGVQCMPELETLYVEGNPIQRELGTAYRRKVQLILPQVRQLDATYVTLLTNNRLVRR